jgi:restriction system protein
MKTDSRIWGIHAGAHGQADALFESGVVAIGWNDTGSLAGLPNSREPFKELVQRLYPDDKPGSWPVTGGMLYRFVHELNPGDVVVNRSKVHKRFRIGRITGGYVYKPDDVHAHQRAVTWLATVEPVQLTQGALYEVNSALSLFSIRNYAEEWLALLGGTSPGIEGQGESSDDPTVGLVAEEIETLTRDFVLSRLLQHLKGHPFAHFVGHLLNLMGYQTRISPEGPDGGVDIIAHRDELGFEPPLVKVQVKSTSGSIGQPEVSSLSGTLGPNEFGLVVTLGTFTSQARTFDKSKSNMRLLDRDDVIDLVLSHYEELDNRYKRLIPMKRVYVAQELEP